MNKNYNKQNASPQSHGVLKRKNKNKFKKNNGNVLSLQKAGEIDSVGIIKSKKRGLIFPNAKNQVNDEVMNVEVEEINGSGNNLSPTKKRKRNAKVEIFQDESKPSESVMSKKQRKKEKRKQRRQQALLNSDADSLNVMKNKKRKQQQEESVEEPELSDSKSEVDLNESESDSPKKKQKKRKKLNDDLESEANLTDMMKTEMKREIERLIEDPELRKRALKSEGDLSEEEGMPYLDYDSSQSVGDSSSSEDEDEVDEKGVPAFKRTKGKKEIVRDSPEKQNRTLFVGNIPVKMDVKALKKVFKPFGKVESVRFRSAIPTKTSISKKIANIKHDYHKDVTSLKGFVVFERAADAEDALRLNGTLLYGNHIRVDKAFAGKQLENRSTVFVGNLPFKIVDEELWNTFSSCGSVKNVRVIRDPATGASKGFGFVLFENESSVQPALALNGIEVGGRPVRVKLSEVSNKGGTPDNKNQRQKGYGQRNNMRQMQNTNNNFNRGNNKQDKRKFGFNKFRKGGQNDTGSHKTVKKLMNKRKTEQNKKKIASIFKDKDSK